MSAAQDSKKRPASPSPVRLTWWLLASAQRSVVRMNKEGHTRGQESAAPRLCTVGTTRVLGMSCTRLASLYRCCACWSQQELERASRTAGLERQEKYLNRRGEAYAVQRKAVISETVHSVLSV